jgi:hypothetical protein
MFRWYCLTLISLEYAGELLLLWASTNKAQKPDVRDQKKFHNEKLISMAMNAIWAARSFIRTVISCCTT